MASSAALAALLRRLPASRPPPLARGKVMSTMDSYGRSVHGGGSSALGRSRLGAGSGPSRPGKPGQGGLPPMPMHYQALQRISDQLSEGLAGLAGGPLQALRERSARLRKRNELTQQEEVFEECRQFLMEPETWTYGKMAGYQRKLLDLLGANGWRRRFAEDDPNVQHLEKELRVLEAMTPVELMSNHKRVFTLDAKKLIAEKSGTTVRYVDEVLLEHDILRGDRRWYQILEQFKRPLPKSFQDREYMAEYDRPFSQTEMEYQEDMRDKHQRIAEKKKPARLHNIWFRQPTIGGNRWSTRPPRWYPVNWRMRPERRERLAGVRPGGGGDRGQPWGRLAGFHGAAR